MVVSSLLEISLGSMSSDCFGVSAASLFRAKLNLGVAGGPSGMLDKGCDGSGVDNEGAVWDACGVSGCCAGCCGNGLSECWVLGGVNTLTGGCI